MQHDPRSLFIEYKNPLFYWLLFFSTSGVVKCGNNPRNASRVIHRVLNLSITLPHDVTFLVNTSSHTYLETRKKCVRTCEISSTLRWLKLMERRCARAGTSSSDHPRFMVCKVENPPNKFQVLGELDQGLFSRLIVGICNDRPQ